MGRSVTPSYVLTLKLNTDASDESFLHKQFFLSYKIHNRLVSHEKPRKLISYVKNNFKKNRKFTNPVLFSFLISSDILYV